ncbi:PREDICTED: uncharacterized protein LOC104812588 [Tarenaya hassleriana]|uniref:uncharacterized protein LOC104812588 n=1 Tax=Tarenaya hassleriana TaxID=28532 RepID=UPI0008FD2CF0|nr:PREDICTED: uncharacterized protein LOC104812588 [Tarenaya hassleriana]
MASLRWRQWWNTVAFPTRRIWNRVGVRLGFRNTGLLKLQHDVRSCEYEDIHIMWDLLHKNEDLGRSRWIQKKRCWNLLSSYLCQRF